MDTHFGEGDNRRATHHPPLSRRFQGTRRLRLPEAAGPHKQRGVRRYLRSLAVTTQAISAPLRDSDAARRVDGVRMM
ncbi:hypothetical protein B296_00041820 [Ensete ventricosum]|uniref:Uncharacterized protein n=1 Tax=Ensete ventricosum TaxID=4639 RepID=A0A426ZKH3_ENSVE|nr:hypothetical protein B296_00041820 [Ensete ventricosum]